MKKYEELTGKLAIWRGTVTKGYLRWKDGERDYYSDKKRISVYISTETEKKWSEFLKNSKFSSFSKLIRESVNNYVNVKSEFGERLFSDLDLNTESDKNHVLKERLTTIKGFLQLLLVRHKKELKGEMIDIINNGLNVQKEIFLLITALVFWKINNINCNVQNLWSIFLKD